MVYGRDCVLLVEFSIASWATVAWEEVRTRDELLIARMKQLDEHSLDIALAAGELERSRKGNKQYFDATKRLRTASETLSVGDLVLLHNSSIVKSHNIKLLDCWLGPYRIREVSDAGFYRLEELDGVHLTESFAGNRLKRFYPRAELERARSQSAFDENASDDLEDEARDEPSSVEDV